MSYQVLARRWRPQKFEDVVGQGHIVRSLQNSLKEDRVGHAYIFSGTRGIGKTSIARIFAKSLRCVERLDDGNACGTCTSCTDFNTNSSMDVIEIDGASNNSVDDIRDLIGNIQYLPTSGKYKVYIIDEVHMLSTSAFNALLKTLEEPPEHAIFILATTEPEKLLGTVLSRCQRFDFRNASVKDLVVHLKKIAETEGITFEKEALISELAKLGNGSFRDTLSLMDQVLSFSIDKNVSEDVFARSLGVAKTSAIRDIVTGVIRGDAQLISDTYRTIISENVTVKNIVKSLLESVFAIISSKDFGNYARVSDRISEEDFNNTARAELYWIYEVLAQDFSWSLESLSPEDATELVLRKVALRHDFIAEVEGGGHSTVGKSQEVSEPEPLTAAEPEKVIETTPAEVPVETEEPKEVIDDEPPMPEEPPFNSEDIEVNEEPRAIKIIVPDKEEVERELAAAKAAESEESEEATASLDSSETSNDDEEKIIISEDMKNWEGFLKHLSINSPAASSNLEQGNLLSPVNYTGDAVAISLGFPTSAKVFFDYLNESESYNKLQEALAEFFGVDKEKVSLSLDLVEKEKAEKEDFKSKFEIKVEAEEKEKEKKIQEIEADPLIKHAEDIFGSQIDKILLNEKK